MLSGVVCQPLKMLSGVVRQPLNACAYDRD
jgi:hypothetical protein